MLRYKVQKGDTLSTIGKKYKVPWSYIRAANPSIKPKSTLIYSNQILRIPRSLSEMKGVVKADLSSRLQKTFNIPKSFQTKKIPKTWLTRKRKAANILRLKKKINLKTQQEDFLKHQKITDAKIVSKDLKTEDSYKSEIKSLSERYGRERIVIKDFNALKSIRLGSPIDLTDRLLTVYLKRIDWSKGSKNLNAQETKLQKFADRQSLIKEGKMIGQYLARDRSMYPAREMSMLRGTMKQKGQETYNLFLKSIYDEMDHILKTQYKETRY